MTEMNSTICANCGITFSFSKQIEENWRRTEKTFYCPNGHALSWPKLPEEVISLRKENKELREKLKSSAEEINILTKKIDALKLEIDIWKPSEPIQ